MASLFHSVCSSQWEVELFRVTTLITFFVALQTGELLDRSWWNQSNKVLLLSDASIEGGHSHSYGEMVQGGPKRSGADSEATQEL